MSKTKFKLIATSGAFPRRRTPEEISADRQHQMEKDHLSRTMDRNQRYEAMAISSRLSAEKKKEKNAEKKSPVKKFVVMEDMIPNISLHKLTV